MLQTSARQPSHQASEQDLGTTKEDSMTTHRTIIAVASALMLTSAAQASELQALRGRSIDLGELAGVAYYTPESDGFRVVATLAQGESGAPVRFEAVLLPGQTVVLSTIRAVDATPVAIKVSREGDRVLVLEASAPSWNEVVVLDAPATN
jgi:hypothetical protein